MENLRKKIQLYQVRGREIESLLMMYCTFEIRFYLIVSSLLAGWGSWAGLGVKEKRKRKAADDEGPEKDEEEGEDRKDVHLKYVIINHRRDKKAAKHMVSTWYDLQYNYALVNLLSIVKKKLQLLFLLQVSKLPYPLTDGIQFKKMMATPIGRDWNTETRFSKLIRPR